MYLLLTALFFAATPSAQASTVWDKSLAASAETFRAEYELDRGAPPASTPVGFHLARSTGEMATTVYHLENGRLEAHAYGCHAHTPQEFDCHGEGRTDLGAYTRGGAQYSLADLREALHEALALFVRKIGAEATIASVKIWESGHLYFSFTHGAGQKAFMMCHQHGAHLDCHRESRPGANEPR